MLKPSVLSWDRSYVSYTNPTKECPSCWGCCQGQSSIEFLDMSALVPFDPGDGDNQNTALLTPQRPKPHLGFKLFVNSKMKLFFVNKVGPDPKHGISFICLFTTRSPSPGLVSAAFKCYQSSFKWKGFERGLQKKCKLSLDHTLLSKGAPNIRIWR